MSKNAAKAIAAKPPSWTARMMALDVADGLPAFAPERLRTIYESLVPPDTTGLTAKLVARLPQELSLYFRGMLFIRNVSA